MLGTVVEQVKFRLASKILSFLSLGQQKVKLKIRGKPVLEQRLKEMVLLI